MTAKNLSTFYGAEYYPDHVPEEQWQRDIAHMREAGFNVTRLAEFAWCRLEPSQDHFEFGWLDRAIDLFSRHDIRVIIGTPTAGPPAWLFHAPTPDLECRQVYEEGGRWEFGARSSLCVNHPHFIARSVRIAEALARRYHGHPNVVAFQIDNELGMYGTRCYCPVCHAKFREWLQAKYGTIAALNTRLGMVFGSNEFRTFDDVPLPRRKQDLHNPGLILDSQRFFSDSHVAYARAQADALRGAGVKQPITTNVCHMVSGWSGIDNRKLFRTLDVAGFDCYPLQFAAEPRPETVGLLHAIARSYKEGRGHWMLEQQAGSPFEMPAGDPRRIRLWAWQSLAHGAQMLLYWHYRQHRSGGEQYWRGIVESDGSLNQRYEVVRQIGREVARLDPVLQSRSYRNDVAILLNFDSEQSLFLNSPGIPFMYRSQAETYFRARNADVVEAVPAPGQYRVLITPSLRLVSDEDAGKLRAFVENGGTLISTFLTGALTPDHVVPPFPLGDLFGIRKVEWSAMGRPTRPPKERLGEDAALWAQLGSDAAFPIVAAPGSPLTGVYSASTWIDHLETTGAQTWARFATGSPAPNAPAVTVNSFGKGRAIYVASLVDSSLARALVNTCLPPEGPSSASEWIEIVTAGLTDRHLYFILNHSPDPSEVTLPGSGRDLLGERDLTGRFTVQGYDVLVLAVQR